MLLFSMFLVIPLIWSAVFETKNLLLEETGTFIDGDTTIESETQNNTHVEDDEKLSESFHEVKDEKLSESFHEVKD